jgi:hypothetical protein
MAANALATPSQKRPASLSGHATVEPAGASVTFSARRANHQNSVKCRNQKYFALLEFCFTVSTEPARAAMRDDTRS